MEQRNPSPADKRESSRPEMPTALELAAAICDALNLPVAAPGAERYRDQAFARRAESLRSQLHDALTSMPRVSEYWFREVAVRSIRLLANTYPVTYPVLDEHGVPTCGLCSVRMVCDEDGFWLHEDTDSLGCAPAADGALSAGEQGGVA